MIVNILLRKTKLDPNSSPNFLLPIKSQRKIDAIESHPIYVILPIFPLPPDKTVSKSANILIISEINNKNQKLYYRLLQNLPKQIHSLQCDIDKW